MENLSLQMSEVVWVEEECHESKFPFKAENCKLEETPASFDHTESFRQGIEENICISEEMQFASVKCKEGLNSEVHQTGVLDVEEDSIIKDENTLTNPVEEAMRLPSEVSESQSGEIVPQTSYARIEETRHCRPCDMQFQSLSDFEIHIIKTHKRMNKFHCTKCKKNFNYWSELLEHFVIHCNIKSMSCNVCAKQFSHSGNMKKHLATHSDMRPFSCKVCGKYFKRIGDVKRHAFIHNKKENFCFKCREVFRTKEELKHHVSSSHARRSDSTFQCPHCPKAFSCYTKLMLHTDVHFSAWKHGCSICKKIFSRRSYLFRHMQDHARTGSTSVTSKILRKPRRLKVDYPCRFCGKVFSWLSKLKRHVIKHTKEKRFLCKICSRGFATKCGLKYHTTKHTGDLLYSCPYCNKKFPANSSVTAHIRVHYVVDP